MPFADEKERADHLERLLSETMSKLTAARGEVAEMKARLQPASLALRNDWYKCRNPHERKELIFGLSVEFSNLVRGLANEMPWRDKARQRRAAALARELFETACFHAIRGGAAVTPHVEPPEMGHGSHLVNLAVELVTVATLQAHEDALELARLLAVEKDGSAGGDA
jgi:hypothetical protein